MSVHIEWMAASDGVKVVPAGTEIGQDTVDAGHVALVFGADSLAVVEGTPKQVRDILTRALAALEPGLVVRNVNEDGETYAEYDHLGGAIATLREFPNDSIVITSEV